MTVNIVQNVLLSQGCRIVGVVSDLPVERRGRVVGCLDQFLAHAKRQKYRNFDGVESPTNFNMILSEH